MTITDDLQYQETIALLQEELARLEAELQAREAADYEAVADLPGDQARRDDLDRQVAALTVEVSARDETIALLVEQIRRAEEAEIAAQAEWDQLNLWVAEVERRVEGLGTPPADDRAAIEAERRRAEDDRLALEAEQRAWVGRREALEAEVAHLRAALAAVARDGPADDRAALDAFARETDALRAARDSLAPVAAEAEALRARLLQVEDEAAALRRALEQERDDRRRERIERDAARASERGQDARDALLAAAAPAPEAPLSIDDRIRVLRHHLIDIDEQERRERSGKRLSTRLSRLWNRTSPR